MAQQLFIAGGGIGGLAAALASARAGWEPRLFEQAAQLSEAGAGIQLGPNATRLLQAWGLGPALAQAAFSPSRLDVRSAATGRALARMALRDFEARYGAPYLTVHRADLQSMLLQAVRAMGRSPETATRVASASDAGGAVVVRTSDTQEHQCDVLVGADGLWSAVRAAVCGDAPPSPTGHVAWRALVSQSSLPEALRVQHVTVWLGPRLHFVCYPVRAGDLLNAVAIVHGAGRGVATDWDQAGAAPDLHAAMGLMCTPLQDLVHALAGWRLWTLHDRPPVRGPEAMARGRIALVGDAAHPMRPYLAQGAAMAMEDAAELGRCLSRARGADVDVPVALGRYALSRWQRVARVQQKSRRNSWIFHAAGPVRWGRDVALRVLGERLLDQPWLYSH